MTTLALAARHWREGIIGALLIALALMWLGKGMAERQAEKWRKEYHAASATLDVQSAMVAAAKAEADRKAKQAADALAEQKKLTKVAESLAVKLEKHRPLSGRCETPADVMGAGL